MRSVVAVIKLTGFAGLILLTVPFQALVLLFCKGSSAYVLPFLWHRGVCRLLGVKIKVHGTPETGKQVFFVGNHLSYLDIPAIGSVIRGSFVAKKDVESWPLFGFLSKLQQTAFISRSREDATREKTALDHYLSEGKSLILFPEGTSTDGQTVLPFKSSLFSIALREQVHGHLILQPFTVKLVLANGQTPTTQAVRDLYAWHNEMDTPLHTHLWLFAKSRGAELALVFHQPVRASEYKDRKVLAKVCHEHVSKGLETDKNTP